MNRIQELKIQVKGLENDIERLKAISCHLCVKDRQRRIKRIEKELEKLEQSQT